MDVIATEEAIAMMVHIISEPFRPGRMVHSMPTPGEQILASAIYHLRVGLREYLTRGK